MTQNFSAKNGECTDEESIREANRRSEPPLAIPTITRE